MQDFAGSAQLNPRYNPKRPIAKGLGRLAGQISEPTGSLVPRVSRPTTLRVRGIKNLRLARGLKSKGYVHPRIRARCSESRAVIWWEAFRDASGAGFAANPSSQPAPQNRMGRAAKPHCRSGRCGSARGAQRRRNPAYHPFRRRQFKLLLRFFFTELTCSNSSSVLVRALLSTDGSTAADQFLPT